MQAEEKKALDAACDQFRALMEKQLERAKKIKKDKDFTDYQSLDKIVIGICGGDGIGPIITKESQRVIEFLLKDEVEQGKIEFKVIDGLTIENRAAHNQAIPDDVLAELDDIRQNYLLKSINDNTQTVITSVDTILFEEEFLKDVIIYKVDGGKIV